MPVPANVASLTEPVIDPKVSRVYIIPLKEDGTFDEDLERAFQYWPETLTDSRGDSGWQEKVVPGGSHPLLQWTAGGGRRVSFSVFFGRDQSMFYEEDIGQVPGATVTANEEDTDNVDVAAAIAWLRYYTYPQYKQNSVEVLPPPSLMLVFPRTRLGSAFGAGEAQGGRGLDEFFCVMTSCEVTYHSWFPDGSIRLAEASLEFLETVQWGGGVVFHDRRSLLFAFQDLYRVRKLGK